MPSEWPRHQNHHYHSKHSNLEPSPEISLAELPFRTVSWQGHIQRLFGHSAFYRQNDKTRAESIATLRTSDNIRRHNEI